jgi:predicted ATPase
MSEIQEIRKQFQNGSWKKFVNAITIDKIRGWENQTVRFQFPVSVLVGENGSGKSTVLRAVVCAYENDLESAKSYYPSKLFLNTPWDTASVQKGSMITYEIKEGEKLSSDSKWKKTQDWGYSPKGHRPHRAVVFLDISRTLPLDATAGYAKIAQQAVEELGKDVSSIGSPLMEAYSHIMGGEYSTGRFVNASNKEVGLLNRGYGEISQFHQGAGEDSLLDLWKILQTIPEQALLVIDEVDASLHPKAQRRLIKFLLTFARKRKIQVILSTHSPYILEEIPPEGRILIQKLHAGSRDIQYCVSSNYAMCVIDDEKHPDLYIYVEDKEAKTLLLEIIKKDNEVFSRVAIKDVGNTEVVKTLGRLCRNKKLPDKGIAVLDGDAGEDINGNCLKLPSEQSPELLVFTEMKKKQWQNLDRRFGLGAGNLFTVFEDALTAPDHHNISAMIGDSVSKSKDMVWSIFVEEWCRQCLDTNYPDYADKLLSKIKEMLNEGQYNA